MWKVVGPGKVFVKSRIESRTGSWFTQRTEPLTPVPKDNTTSASDSTNAVVKKEEDIPQTTATRA